MGGRGSEVNAVLRREGKGKEEWKGRGGSETGNGSGAREQKERGIARKKKVGNLFFLIPLCCVPFATCYGLCSKVEPAQIISFSHVKIPTCGKNSRFPTVPLAVFFYKSFVT